MDRILRQLAKFALAALFGAASTTAIFASAATQAGSPATGFLSATPVAALADDRRFRRYGYVNRNYGYWLGGRFFITIAYSNYQPVYYPPVYYGRPAYYPNYGYRTSFVRFDRDDRFRRSRDRDDRNFRRGRR
jgi:hypothetical protein